MQQMVAVNTLLSVVEYRMMFDKSVWNHLIFHYQANLSVQIKMDG